MKNWLKEQNQKRNRNKIKYSNLVFIRFLLEWDFIVRYSLIFKYYFEIVKNNKNIIPF